MITGVWEYLSRGRKPLQYLTSYNTLTKNLTVTADLRSSYLILSIRFYAEAKEYTRAWAICTQVIVSFEALRPSIMLCCAYPKMLVWHVAITRYGLPSAET